MYYWITKQPKIRDKLSKRTYLESIAVKNVLETKTFKKLSLKKYFWFLHFSARTILTLNSLKENLFFAEKSPAADKSEKKPESAAVSESTSAQVEIHRKFWVLIFQVLLKVFIKNVNNKDVSWNWQTKL